MKRLTQPLLGEAMALREEGATGEAEGNKPGPSEEWLIASTVLGLDDPFHHVRRGLHGILLQKRTEVVSETGSKDVSQIRHGVGNMERHLAQLLDASLKLIQGFEQGWRKVPLHTRRQLLFLRALKASRKEKGDAMSGDMKMRVAEEL